MCHQEGTNRGHLPRSRYQSMFQAGMLSIDCYRQGRPLRCHGLCLCLRLRDVFEVLSCRGYCSHPSQYTQYPGRPRRQARKGRSKITTSSTPLAQPASFTSSSCYHFGRSLLRLFEASLAGMTNLKARQPVPRLWCHESHTA